MENKTYDEIKNHVGKLVEYLPFYDNFRTKQIELRRDYPKHWSDLEWPNVVVRGRLSVFYDYDGTMNYGITDGETKYFLNGKEINLHADFYMQEVIPEKALAVIELKVLE